MIKKSTLGTILANYAPEALAGLLVGGGLGAMSSRKNRLRNMLIGMLGGAAVGAGARHAMAGKDILRANKFSNNGLIPDIRVKYRKGSWKKFPGVEEALDMADKGIDKIKKAEAGDARRARVDAVKATVMAVKKAEAVELHRARVNAVKSVVMSVKQADDHSARTTISEYEKGFLTKCAELNVDDAFAREMLKTAQSIFGRVGGWIDKGLDKTVGAASRWAGRNWDKSIKPALGTAAGASLGAIGGPLGMLAGGYIGNKLSRNPGMQPVQTGAKAIQQNGKIVNPKEIAERYAKQKGWNTNPGQQAQPAAPAAQKQPVAKPAAPAAQPKPAAKQPAAPAAQPAAPAQQSNPALQPLPPSNLPDIQMPHQSFWNSVPNTPFRTVMNGRKPVDATRDGYTQGMNYKRNVQPRQRIATPGAQG